MALISMSLKSLKLHPEVIKNANVSKTTTYEDSISLGVITKNSLTLCPVITHFINQVIRRAQFPYN